jgi:hypothetical protein
VWGPQAFFILNVHEDNFFCQKESPKIKLKESLSQKLYLEYTLRVN